MPLDDFSKIRLFKNQTLELVNDQYMDNYINRGVQMQLEENKKTYLFSTYKGVTLVSDFLGQDVESCLSRHSILE